MKQKILVLGGSYFIGRAITRELLKNYTVYTLNRGTKPNFHKKIITLKCDRHNQHEMKIVLDKHEFDCVVDVSGVTKEESEILISALNTNKVKAYVFISSSAVYDVDNLTAPFKETNALATNSYWADYGTDKIASEEFLINHFVNTDISLTILRPPFVYGENNYAQRESFIFDRLYNDLPVVIPNEGKTRLQFIYAGDLAKTVYFFLQNPMTGTNIFNVGSSESVSVLEWVNFCAAVVNKKAKIIPYDYKKADRNIRDFFPFFDYDNVLDVSKLKTVFPHETDFSVGLKAAYNWYLQNKNNIIFKENVTNSIDDILKDIKT
ncbi:epimerase [Clostridia bacterium]|nr:epimerase [Clostridia bacterium]